LLKQACALARTSNQQTVVMKFKLIGLLLCLPLLFWHSANAEEPEALLNTIYSGEIPWQAEDADGQTQIRLYFFWSKFCPHCHKALPFVAELEQEFPWLDVRRFELANSEENLDLYMWMTALLEQPPQAVPGFMFCDDIQVGFDDADTTGVFLRQKLQACYDKYHPASAGTVQDDTEAIPKVHVPGLGEISVSDISLPLLTVVIAGLDAFNPCAFFVLLFLLSLMVRACNRKRMLFIGLIFVGMSGLIYFVFMAAWLNVFLMIGELYAITVGAAILAVIVGLLNIKDYFYFNAGGISLSIPESAKPRLFERMRRLMESRNLFAFALGTILLAIAANAYELLCTSGFPMIYTRLLTLENLPVSTYYLYLALYNVVYVLPLLLIVLLFTYTLGAHKLQEFEGRILKLMSGIMMLCLGLILLLAPNLLSNIWIAGGILLVSLAIALPLYFYHKSRVGA
jgi:thiol-disulfide isomerase/thioredoxin